MPPATATTERIPQSVELTRLTDLRELAERDPAAAREGAWQWLRELDSANDHEKLSWLFAQGTAPESPDGDTDGMMVGLLSGRPDITLAGWLQAIGTRLGFGWTGKTFNRETGTGYNRLTSRSRIPMTVLCRGYRFRRHGAEVIGFDFDHRVEASAYDPTIEVRAIIYAAPEYRNPVPVDRTRDEIVEIVPGVHLGHALLQTGGDIKRVGYFACRERLDHTA